MIEFQSYEALEVADRKLIQAIALARYELRGLGERGSVGRGGRR